MAHAIWLDGAMVHVREVCLGHKQALGAEAAMAFAPLDTLPPIERLARYIEDEHMRRAQQGAAAQARAGQPLWMHTTGTMWSSTTTGTVFNFVVR